MIFFVDENDEDIRLDSFLASVTENLSRSKIQNLIKSGSVKVNDTSKKPSYQIKENDKIELEIPDSKAVKIQPENIPLEIVYEDENMLVINKPSGMLTHPTTQEKSETLVNALLYKYQENLSDINGEFRRGIVHRLDRNTSGLLMIAKNNKTHEYLADMIKNHNLTKKYRAIVKGNYPLDEDIIELPIGRHPTQPHKMAVVENGKESKTIINVIERFKEATFLDITLITGRTHQIRVHLSQIGYPIVGDEVYSNGKNEWNVKGQCLHAKSLEFTHPSTGQKMYLEAKLPEYFENILKDLENRKL